MDATLHLVLEAAGIQRKKKKKICLQVEVLMLGIWVIVPVD